MNIWLVEHFFEHICHHFWVGATGATANPPKSDDKYAQKSVQLVRGSSFRSDFLQNPYFSFKNWHEMYWYLNKIHCCWATERMTCIYLECWFEFLLHFICITLVYYYIVEQTEIQNLIAIDNLINFALVYTDILLWKVSKIHRHNNTDLINASNFHKSNISHCATLPKTIILFLVGFFSN